MLSALQSSFRLAVFGLGEVGSALVRLANRKGWRVDGFSRNQDAGLGRIFDASNSQSISNLKRSLSGTGYDALVVTLPPQEVAPDFWDLLEGLSARRILLGSTSIYRRLGSGRSLISEATPLRPGHDRLATESGFLQKGGVVVRLSGIYSPVRNPVRRLKLGRVGYEDRQLNLVHRDDITGALMRMATAPQLKAVYNLSDGQEHTWVQIIDRLVQWQLVQNSRVPVPLKRENGFVQNTRFLNDFQGFEFRDFWQELKVLAAP